MGKIKVTAVFDIGKTNKKFFLFDAKLQEVYREYAQFDEIKDEDGFPTENLPELQKWLKDLFDRILTAETYDIKAINFSTYGASLVHLDNEGKVLGHLYNYLKPIPKDIIEEFHATYQNVPSMTGSPKSGMLNSGMQLYWLKKTNPERYGKIKYSLHFPQYISYLFTGIPLSEYTSIGCHTALWDYEKNDYHNWVYQEGINEKLAPIVASQTSINMVYNQKRINIGVGIHDSSSALLPYIFGNRTPFLLLSTGTWSISLNPFNNEQLTMDDIANNCLNYMRIDGTRVKATRFFMGNEYKIQVKKLGEHYGKEYGYHRSVKFNQALYLELIENPSTHFKFEGIQLKRKQLQKTDLEPFKTFEEAFHQLMIELMELQVRMVKMAIGDVPIRKIYIDGGFADNDIFVKLMGIHFKEYSIRTTVSPLGSALGAAMVISNKKLSKDFLKENYKMKKLIPLKLA
ncbi:carbohydrate kinase [Muricauda sp. CAU 1633]|uniref:FGGY-family carbohydrate kinase n=1 Tax=Allomuricauda sp. CAU 1633 TaxID=2816036 RepID=UPI001A8CB9F7|nr:FGGY family carbohydrate kinase [Muricauda sp. CAU 1633]MBO0324090.1 carbohydrate kinase [Muricauda sp. CAU 1633]